MRSHQSFRKTVGSPGQVSSCQAIFLCLLVTILLSACDDNDSPATVSQIIPLKKGNTWIYSDTTTTDTGILTETDTSIVLESGLRRDTTWWMLSKRFNPYIETLSFAALPQGIFSLQYIPIDEISEASVSKEYIDPPAGNQFSFIFESFWEVALPYKKTVTVLKTPVVTPAGTFNSCYEYTYNLPPDAFNLPSVHITETVCPGIGVIRITATSDGTTQVPPYYTKYTKYTRTLIKYTVQ